MHKLCSGQAQYMYLTILTFIWPLWPWPSTYLKKCFKWHFSSSRATTVPTCFEIHALLYKLWSWQIRRDARTHWRMHIHQTKIVTTMSRLPASGLDKTVSNGTSPPQRQQLCHTVSKSMHYCTSYGPDKSGRMHGCTHIHRTKIVTTMSCLPASGLDKKVT